MAWVVAGVLGWIATSVIVSLLFGWAMARLDGIDETMAETLAVEHRPRVAERALAEQVVAEAHLSTVVKT
jgi:hypothetical protein